ncbi:unnamed protein product [Prunus armeniaca]
MIEVVRKEVLKLLDVGIIYPIFYSKWVSPIQVVSKKSGITVVKNEGNELFPSCVQTRWHVCIYYMKLNTATGYNQIVIAQEDYYKTTFTCPYDTFAYRHIPFGLCNASAIFKRCMMSTFLDMVEKFIKECNLILNREKCHFIVQQGIVFGYVISSKDIEVDKPKVDVIRSLPPPSSVKEIQSFLGHGKFSRRFITEALAELLQWLRWAVEQ